MFTSHELHWITVSDRRALKLATVYIIINLRPWPDRSPPCRCLASPIHSPTPLLFPLINYTAAESPSPAASKGHHHRRHQRGIVTGGRQRGIIIGRRQRVIVNGAASSTGRYHQWGGISSIERRNFCGAGSGLKRVSLEVRETELIFCKIFKILFLRFTWTENCGRESSFEFSVLYFSQTGILYFVCQISHKTCSFAMSSTLWSNRNSFRDMMIGWYFTM